MPGFHFARAWQKKAQYKHSAGAHLIIRIGLQIIPLED
jgi:hypothetical protein